MLQPERASVSMQPAIYISVYLPDGTQILKTGMGLYLPSRRIITCGPFRTVMPVKGKRYYVIRFYDTNMRLYHFRQCRCLQVSAESSFVLGTEVRAVKK